ncbi:MAG: hypothetical protein ACI8QS_000571 [Planctomycetota bacterium]|jgi:hypothetical protein
MRAAGLLRFPGSLLGLLLLAVLQLPALGQASLQLFDSTVEIEALSQWPARVHSGWVPIQVQAWNSGDRTRSFDVSLTTNSWNETGANVERAVTLGPGERTEFELLVPALDGGYRTYNLQVRMAGSQHYASGALALGPTDKQARTAVILRRRAVIGSVETEWEELLSGEVLTGRSGDFNRTSLAALTWDKASRRSEAYTSLDLVLVPTEDGAPPGDVLGALRSWVNQGGQVGFVGKDARAVAEGAGFSPWLEDRFQQETGGQIKSWRSGHGRVHLLSGELTPGSGEFPAAGEWQDILYGDSDRPWLESLRDVGAEEFWRWPVIPGLEDLPYRGFLALLLCFALLIGPANFFLVQKRWKRPPLLLVTIPLISAVATLGILAFGVFSQGIHVREAVVSRSVLDQREHLAATLERRTFFVGLSPGSGLRPGSNTSVFAFPDRSLGGSGEYEVVVGDGQLLRGDYLPSRRTVRIAASTEGLQRARLIFERADLGFRVSNALGAEIRQLFLRDSQGDWFALDGSLASDGTAQLESVKLEDCMQEFGLGEVSVSDLEHLLNGETLNLQNAYLWEALQALWPGGYIAVLSDNPLRDECGLNARSEYGDHVVLGVLSLSEEEWL